MATTGVCIACADPPLFGKQPQHCRRKSNESSPTGFLCSCDCRKQHAQTCPYIHLDCNCGLVPAKHEHPISADDRLKAIDKLDEARWLLTPLMEKVKDDRASDELIGACCRAVLPVIAEVLER